MNHAVKFYNMWLDSDTKLDEALELLRIWVQTPSSDSRLVHETQEFIDRMEANDE